ncbi:12619_t:CDS:2 [Entrophospora sp. SA101]|nr:12619_t:CDS:2 [Entrophospora sp. SA101]
MSPLPFAQVTLIKTTFLDLKTLGYMPSIEDFPISPLFGTVTGLCSTPPRSQNGGT